MSLTAPERVYAQYRDKPKTYQWYGIPTQVSAGIQAAADDVRLMYDVDNNSGAQLDIIGNIVVVSRNVLSNILLTVYECGDTSSECGDDEIQCSQPSVQADSLLSDQYFRTLIKSKIQKNNSDATIEGVLSSTDLILESPGTLRVVDNEDMSFSVEFYGNITDIERTLLLTKGIIPKPQGVKFSGFLEGAGLVESGNETLQCGDESAQCVGFIGV